MFRLALLSGITLLIFLNGCSGQQEPSTLFGGLSDNTASATKVEPGELLRFPDDHANHPEFAIEWWYITANLFDEQGKQYPLQWTLFRFLSGNQATPWANNQQYMAHAKLATDSGRWFEERFARGGVGNAGINAAPFDAFMDDWRWHSATNELFPSTLSFTLNEDVEVNLHLSSSAEYVLHGDNGYSIKLRDAEQASYYYSQPFITISGTLSIQDKNIEVSGNAWFDHEWSSQYLDNNTKGWDWFSIHLENGSKLMLFNMRHKLQENFWTGTLIDKSGQQTLVKEQDVNAEIIKYSDVEGRSLPLDWRIDIPAHDLRLTITPFKKQQWNKGVFAYYEGAISIDGPLKGHGFIELTGY